MKKHIIFIWIIFAVMVAIRVFIPRSDYWEVLQVVAVILSIIILVKCKLPSRKYIFISILLAVLVDVSYIGAARNPWVLVYGAISAVPTLLSSLAVFSVMKKHGGYEFISHKGKHPVIKSIVIALLVTMGLLGICFLISNNEKHFSFSAWKLVICLNPGIFEEMAGRAIFMAYFMCFSKDKMNLFERFTMYFMMAMPHAMVHGKGLIETGMLFLMFGLTFSILQKKRDILTPMLSHGLYDAVMFMFVGLPVSV